MISESFSDPSDLWTLSNVSDLRYHPLPPYCPTLYKNKKDYVFEDRAEHEQAFGWAAQVEPQSTIDEADVLPPLLFTPDVLIATADLHVGAVHEGSWGRFREIPVAQVDPRAMAAGHRACPSHTRRRLSSASRCVPGWAPAECILLRYHALGLLAEHQLSTPALATRFCSMTAPTPRSISGLSFKRTAGSPVADSSQFFLGESISPSFLPQGTQAVPALSGERA
jgi:hypothetical protein